MTLGIMAGTLFLIVLISFMLFVAYLVLKK